MPTNNILPADIDDISVLDTNASFPTFTNYPTSTGSLNTMASTTTQPTSGTFTISATSPPSPWITTSASNTMWSNTMEINGSVNASDYKVDGVSLKDILTSIQDRLAILTPDPAKHEKFAALKAAYEHYKTLEALCKDEPTV